MGYVNMRIAIVDDEFIFCTQLEQMLNNFFNNDLFKIEDFCDGREFIDELEKGTIYDIVFLDIEMKTNGYITGELIRKKDKSERTYIIYISAHTENLSSYFKLHPYDFITKPIKQDDINNLMNRLIADINSKCRRLEVYFNKQAFHIPISNITYIESNRRLVIIHLSDGTTKTIYNKLDDILDALNSMTNTFYKINKSYIVNWQYVDKISYSQITIGNTTLKIGDNFKQHLLNIRITNTFGKD